MLHFSGLSLLDFHLNFLKKKINSQNTLFLVGGCIRDMLLDIEKTAFDIDFTLAGKPTEIYNSINKDGLSHFITEKFGTITLIKKNKPGKQRNIIQYECTPLRTESGYQDLRHPEEIHRSNDVLLDSQRRDFTINCLYYTSFRSDEFSLDHLYGNGSNSDLSFLLKKYGVAFVAQKNILILQDHNHINQLFVGGILQKSYFSQLIRTITPEMMIGCHTPTNKKKASFRIIIDPHQGIQSLEQRKLCAVGAADKRFQEDALRIIRALRFVNVVNQKLSEQKKSATLFDFEKDTWSAIKRNRQLLQYIAKERIKDELTKVFRKGNPFGFVALLDETKLLELLFPALYATKFIHQPVRYHPFDIYTHTMLTLYELQQRNQNYLVRFGMLYHDVGKVAQFAEYHDDLNKEEIRAILAGPNNHRRNSPEFVKQDFAALGFSKKEIDDIARYVANHHKPEEILDGGNPEKITKKMRKFLSDAGFEKINDILDITMADRLGQYNPLQNNKDLTEIHDLRKLLKQLHKEEGQFTNKDLVINGSDIIKYFTLEPGKIIGELLHQAFEWVMNDIKTRNKKKEIFQYLTGYLKNKKNLV